MATKNLARSAIEGGRATSNQVDRHYSNTAERRRAHQVEHQLRLGDPLDDACFAPRRPVYKMFSDKLGPAYRYLRSQVGRPWDKVRSELFARFDTRTTAGRHILFDHLLDDVRQAGDVRRHYGDTFVVTRRGILQYRGRQHWGSPYHPQPRLPEPDAVLRRWLGARRVQAHGERLYWLEPTAHGGYRQGHELSPEAARRFRALPDWFRSRFEGTPPPTTGSARSDVGS